MWYINYYISRLLGWPGRWVNEVRITNSLVMAAPVYGPRVPDRVNRYQFPSARECHYELELAKMRVELAPIGPLPDLW